MRKSRVIIAAIAATAAAAAITALALSGPASASSSCTSTSAPTARIISPTQGTKINGDKVTTVKAKLGCTGKGWKFTLVDISGDAYLTSMTFKTVSDATNGVLSFPDTKIGDTGTTTTVTFAVVAVNTTGAEALKSSWTHDYLPIGKNVRVLDSTVVNATRAKAAA